MPRVRSEAPGRVRLGKRRRHGPRRPQPVQGCCRAPWVDTCRHGLGAFEAADPDPVTDSSPVPPSDPAVRRSAMSLRTCTPIGAGCPSKRLTKSTLSAGAVVCRRCLTRVTRSQVAPPVRSNTSTVHPASTTADVSFGVGQSAERRSSARSTIQCHPVCASIADRMMTPRRSGKTNVNSTLSTQTAIRRTAICPSSTPTLNDSSDNRRCEPAN